MKKIQLLFFWVVFLLPFLQGCSENKVEADLATQVSGSYSLEETSFTSPLGVSIQKPNPPFGTKGFRGGDLIITKETENSCKIIINSIIFIDERSQVISSSSAVSNTIALSRSSQNGNTIIGGVNNITFSFSGTIVTMVSSTSPNIVFSFKKK
jgi:hypothetical protein